MKTMKNIFNEQVIYSVFLSSLAISPFTFGQYYAYSSGFAKSYKQAVIRNVNLDSHRELIPSEELKFKQTLLKELRELAHKKKSLSEIVSWLKER